MSSRIEICNLAISHLGVGQTIVGSEDTVEKTTCDTFYDIAREKILTDLNWTFPRKTVALNLLTDVNHPKWTYSYGWPSDCETPVRVFLSGYLESDYMPGPIVNYETGILDGIRCISTHFQDAWLEYTSNLEDTEIYPIDFVIAFSYLLAFFISPKIKGSVYENMYKMYQISLTSATAKEFRSQNKVKPKYSKSNLSRNGIRAYSS